MKSEAAVYASRALLTIAASVGVEETVVQSSSYVTGVNDAPALSSSAELVNGIDIEFDAKCYLEQGVKRPGGEPSLEMIGKHYPKMLLSNCQKIKIPEFGIELDAHGMDIEKLHRAIFRQFQHLEDRAKHDALSSREREYWLAMSKYFDYASYREKSAPLVRAVGELVSRENGQLRVRWHGGDDGMQTVSGALYSKFWIVDPGESFSAMVRFVGGALSDIEDVRREEAPEYDTNDLSWIA